MALWKKLFSGSSGENTPSEAPPSPVMNADNPSEQGECRAGENPLAPAVPASDTPVSDTPPPDLLQPPAGLTVAPKTNGTGSIPKGIPKGDANGKSLFPLNAPVLDAPASMEEVGNKGDAFPDQSLPGVSSLSGMPTALPDTVTAAPKNRQLSPDDIDRSAVFGTDESAYRKVAELALERWKDLPPSPIGEELSSLRKLVMEREIALLEQMKARLDDPFLHAKDVSGIIAEALLLRAKRDSRLGKALEPIVGDILKTVLRKSPIEFANIIFPLMGPAIRRSIAESFRSMLLGFNKSIEIAFSWKGLRWRIEALRTGKPFSEVVLLHNLVYRVDQVIFIHSSTGLVLGHVVNEGINIQDVDMVSAMLTAVQDFVRDCFTSGSETGGDLESLHMGESVILLEKNPFASLACIVRGQPPTDFRNHMRTSLELLLIQYAEQLADFNGDIGQFKGAIPYLEDCLSSRLADEGKPIPLWIRLIPAAAIAGVALFAGVEMWDNYTLRKAQEQNRLAAEQYRGEMEKGIAILKSTRGFLVTNVKEVQNGVWEVTLLKDELAPSPEEILHSHGLVSARYQFDVVPFVSYAPDLITERVSNAIQPPSTVQMNLSANGTLTFSGTAPMEWILSAHTTALTLPGVKAINMKDLVDPRMSALSYKVRQIEAVTIEFPMGKDIPVGKEAQKLDEVVTTLVQLEKLASEMGIAVYLTVYGHADRVGSEKRNYEISQERARTIAAMLYAKGSSMPISLYGFGAQYSKDSEVKEEKTAKPAPKTPDKGARNAEVETGDPSSRRIEFRVHLRQAGDATPDVLKK